MPKFIKINPKGTLYLLFTNKNGKEYLIQKENRKNGLMIYQPASFLGKFYKFLLIYFLPIVIITKKVKLIYINVDFSFFPFLYKESKLDFYFGTPGIDRKMIVQVTNNNMKIIGYIKISDNERSKQNLVREKNALLFLEKIKEIKTPYLISFLSNEDYTMLFQSTTKKVGDATFYKLNKKIVEYIRSFCTLTVTSKEYYKTSFFNEISNKMILTLLPREFDELYLFFLNKINSKLEKEFKFSAFHGDFTPWNFYINESKEIYMFDLEYFQTDFPMNLDLYHFFFQIQFLIHKSTPEQIFKKFILYKRKFDLSNDEFVQYLMHILAFHLLREQKVDNMSFCVLKLLQLIKEKNIL